MKKNFVRLVTCVLVLALALSLAACGGKPATVEDFVKSDAVQSQLKTMKESLGDTMDIDVTGEGNTLVYTFKFPEGTDTTGLGESLEAAMETQVSTFEQIASSLKDAVKVDNPTVKVVYAEHDGTEIYSREFTAE